MQLAWAEPPKRESHFVDCFVPTRNLPQGASLAQLSDLLQKKILLRSDVPGEALSPKRPLTDLYAAVPLEEKKAILAAQVTEGVPPSLADLVPPERELITLYLPNEQLPQLRLCTPYDAVTLSLQSPRSGSAGLQEQRQFASDARRIGLVEGKEATQAIAVFAVLPSEKKAIMDVLNEGWGSAEAVCTKRLEYE